MGVLRSEEKRERHSSRKQEAFPWKVHAWACGGAGDDRDAGDRRGRTCDQVPRSRFRVRRPRQRCKVADGIAMRTEGVVVAISVGACLARDLRGEGGRSRRHTSSVVARYNMHYNVH